MNYRTLQDGSNIMVDFSSTARAAPICALCLSLFKSYKQKLTENVLKKFINMNLYKASKEKVLVNLYFQK